MKPTPGPWTVERVANETGDTLYKCHLFIEPGIAGMWCPPGDLERERYARLIAAAPNLLAACELFIRTLDNPPVNPLALAADRQRVESLARAAVAKAVGTPGPS